jgi:hypothetical protein
MRKFNIPAGTRYLFRRLSPISVGKICVQDLTTKHFKYFYRTICKMNMRTRVGECLLHSDFQSNPNLLSCLSECSDNHVPLRRFHSPVCAKGRRDEGSSSSGTKRTPLDAFYCWLGSFIVDQKLKQPIVLPTWLPG